MPCASELVHAPQDKQGEAPVRARGETPLSVSRAVRGPHVRHERHQTPLM